MLRKVCSLPFESRVTSTGVFAHIVGYEVVWLSDLAFVPDHKPGPAENLLELLLVYFLVVEDVSGYNASLRVYFTLKRAYHFDLRGVWNV